jgi:hypothetical protein
VGGAMFFEAVHIIVYPTYWMNLLVQYTQNRQDPTDTAAD